MVTELPEVAKTIEVFLADRERRRARNHAMEPEMLKMCKRLLLHESSYVEEGAQLDVSKERVRQLTQMVLHSLRRAIYAADPRLDVLEVPLRMSEIRADLQLREYYVQLLSALLVRVPEAQH